MNKDQSMFDAANEKYERGTSQIKTTKPPREVEEIGKALMDFYAQEASVCGQQKPE